MGIAFCGSLSTEGFRLFGSTPEAHFSLAPPPTSVGIGDFLSLSSKQRLRKAACFAGVGVFVFSRNAPRSWEPQEVLLSAVPRRIYFRKPAPVGRGSRDIAAAFRRKKSSSVNKKLFSVWAAVFFCVAGFAERRVRRQDLPVWVCPIGFPVGQGGQRTRTKSSLSAKKKPVRKQLMVAVRH